MSDHELAIRSFRIPSSQLLSAKTPKQIVLSMSRHAWWNHFHDVSEMILFRFCFVFVLSLSDLIVFLLLAICCQSTPLQSFRESQNFTSTIDVIEKKISVLVTDWNDRRSSRWSVSTIPYKRWKTVVALFWHCCTVCLLIVQMELSHEKPNPNSHMFSLHESWHTAIHTRSIHCNLHPFLAFCTVHASRDTNKLAP